MRFVLAFVVACMVAACALGGQSSGERAFISGSAPRSVQAVLDAQAILQGMDQARSTDERVAGDVNHSVPQVTSPQVTR